MKAKLVVREATSRVRHRIPSSAVPFVVRRRLPRALANPDTWELARLHMRFLLERTRPEADVDAAARRYVERMLWRGELRWHPDLMERQQVEGLEHVTGRGRTGLILNFMHHGHYDGAFMSLAARGARVDVMLNSLHFDADQPAHIRRQFALTQTVGTPLDAAEGARGVMERVEAGAAVAIASDVAGTTPVTFVGRQVLGSSGAARIAMMTGARVGVMTAHDTGELQPLVRIHEPLDPRAFDSAEHLLGEMLRIHEEAMVAWPEGADVPAQRWQLVGPEENEFPPPLR